MSGSEAEVSATGTNKFLVRGFANRQKLMNHWRNGRTHREEYPQFQTAEEYEAYALELLEMPVGGDILGHKDGHGNVIRYNRKTNDFAKGNPNTGVRSLYKPEQGEAYYYNALKGDVERGGSK